MIYRRIKDLCLSRKVSVHKLEMAANLGKGCISKWEKSSPSADALKRIAQFFGISMDYLVGLSGTMTPIDGGGLTEPEGNLIEIYRQLTTNSQQIVMTLARMELHHVKANAQAEQPIKVLKKSKQELEDFIALDLETKTDEERKTYIKVYNQSAAAGYGNYVDDDSFETIAVPSVPIGAEFGVRISGDSMETDIKDGDIVFVKRTAQINIGEIGIFIYEGDAFCKRLDYHDGTYYLRSLNKKYKDIPILGDSIYCVGEVVDRL